MIAAIQYSPADVVKTEEGMIYVDLKYDGKHAPVVKIFTANVSAVELFGGVKVKAKIVYAGSRGGVTTNMRVTKSKRCPFTLEIPFPTMKVAA